MMKRIFISLSIMLLTAATAVAQMMNPVHFTAELRMLENDEAEIVFAASIDNGWHVYSTDVPGGGPIPATFHAVRMQGAETIGKLTARGKVIRQHDEMFSMEVSFFEHSATFVQRIKFTKPQYDIDCYLEYGACSNEMCLPPTEVRLTKSGTHSFDKKVEEPVNDEEKKNVDSIVAVTSNDSAKLTKNAESTDTISILNSADAPAPTSTAPLETFLLGLLGGFLAILMPCIWPVIPMTVSFFMRRSEGNRRKGVIDALLYGLSIIVIYVTLGLAVTLLFGSDALNAFSTSAIFNIGIFLMLVVFSLSLFGLFELRLPSSWATALDKKTSTATLSKEGTNTGGNSNAFNRVVTSLLRMAGERFLMALTLVVVSFSCTAPIVGLLLVQVATTNNWLSPLMGMLGFSVALALPFTLFAMFPSWMKQMPHSGEWMNKLKVALAFVELAFSLKFLSVADQAYGWNLLSRELFLALWIIIFLALGIYLLWGKGNSIMRWISIGGGMASLALAAYMVPGLWGAPCKLVSAFAPPMESVKAHYNDFDMGMQAARAQKKPVLIDFTGYGCVNCRKMEATVWTDPRVAKMLKDDYILISLYVDDKTALTQPIEVTDVTGEKKTLRTVGARWSYLQSSRFGSNAQPYYAVLSHDGHQLLPARGYNEDADAYLHFLEEGLKKENNR